MADMSREVVIHPCKMFQSRNEANVEAGGDFIKQMCMLYAYKLFLRFSLKCINPNYLFYSFKWVRGVCPNLPSAPCTQSSVWLAVCGQVIASCNCPMLSQPAVHQAILAKYSGAPPLFSGLVAYFGSYWSTGFEKFRQPLALVSHWLGGFAGGAPTLLVRHQQEANPLLSLDNILGLWLAGTGKNKQLTL